MKFSNFISYFFHPINFSIIGAVIYFLFVPKYIFKQQEYIILVVLFIGTYIFPLILLFLMRKFKLINTYHLTTIEERKFPSLIFISITLFIGQWLYKTTVVNILSLYYFGFGICLILTYIFLLFNRKISLHTSAIGGLIGFILFFSFHYKINFIILLIICFTLSGIIASARLKLRAHSLSEVFIGLTLGICTQLLTYTSYLKYVELQS